MEEKLTNRQLQAINTKNKIYEAAIDLLETIGFDNIRIEDICKQAGVSVGSFYNYFKSKHHILIEIFNRADDYFRDEVAKSLEDKPVFDTVIDYFDYYAKYSETLGIDMIKHFYSSENKMFITEGRYMQNLLHEILISAEKKGELHLDLSYMEVTKQLFVVARGVIFDWCLHDGQYSLRDYMKNFIQRMLKTF